MDGVKAKPDELAMLRGLQAQVATVQPKDTRTAEDILREEKLRAKRDEKERK